MSGGIFLSLDHLCCCTQCFSSNDLGLGAFGGFLISAREQGRTVGELAAWFDVTKPAKMFATPQNKANRTSASSYCFFISSMIVCSWTAIWAKLETASADWFMTSLVSDEIRLISSTPLLISSLVADCCSAAVAMERT
ncbi:hypothetical protein SAMN05660653_02306 [Desulfonatronum thiosulfatophilum]|uniref:Uncharacterized protein n=1 Tax=Desulfonatronum thiosulfatophilum TaxID=617002 RepID=A0A1G6DQ82_9BACT|nr:hypothetical protein SAMN05660653_02306 [Desulfonatronum thiosulfatophilum]